MPNNPLTLGYGAFWTKNKLHTWSGTPARLVEALYANSEVSVVDLNLSEGGLYKHYLKVKGLQYWQGRLQSNWRLNPAYRSWEERSLVKSLAGKSLDAVLTIGDRGCIELPLFWYQDLSFVTLLSMVKSGVRTYQYDRFKQQLLSELAEKQILNMQRAVGIFTMSKWDKDAHIALGVVDPNKIHVVYGGFSVPVIPPDAATWRPPDEHRERIVLFIGREFERKGGDLVFEAVRKWRDGADYPIRFVVAGPPTWPLPQAQPAWVTFLGETSYEVLQQHLAVADVFAMPSRFEAYGIVFAEALASGIPVVGRNAFAMPEFVEHGKNGYLITSDDILALAEYLESASENVSIRRHVVNQAHDVAQRYSWNSVAASMVTVIKSNLGG